MQRLIDRIDRLATPRNLFLAIMLSAVSIILMVYSTQIMVYDIYGNVDMPDLMFGYTFNDIIATFDSLGSDGLNAWVQAHVFDALFPIGFSSSLAFGLAMLMRNTLPDRKKEKIIVLLPIMAAIADYIENILIASQATSYPIVSEQIIAIASVVTVVKWLLLYIAFALVFVLLLVYIFKKIKLRKNN